MFILLFVKQTPPILLYYINDIIQPNMSHCCLMTLPFILSSYWILDLVYLPPSMLKQLSLTQWEQVCIAVTVMQALACFIV